MKNIILLLFAIFALANLSCSDGTAKNSHTTEEVITFYEVPLVCTAAPEIGCGTRSKPVLLEMEQNPSIKEAWLNRAGTVYAIVWKNAEKTDEVAKPIFVKYSLDFKRLSDQEAARIATAFREPGKWYRGADVDKLSTEEAGVIARDAITFALDKKLVSSNEADILRNKIESYLKLELTKTRTAEELRSNDIMENFKNNIFATAAQVVGQERATKIFELYMATNPLDKLNKDSSCNKGNDEESCCKKK